MSDDANLLLNAGEVRFSYGDEPVLGGVDLEMRAGAMVGLLGPNGSGKTTLIQCLLGDLKAQGSIVWFGRNVKDWPRRELARSLAYLPQSPAYQESQTVGEVIRLGRAPYWGAFGLESRGDLEMAEHVAAQLELGPLLGRRMDQLSGGQRQRVLLGRCLVQEPRALLLDEPGTFLDLGHQVGLYRHLRALAREKGIGVLMAMHDLNLAAAYADRVVLLDGGKVVAQGTADEVLRPEVLSPVYGLPIARHDHGGGGILVFPA